jgi:hypothetical protein
MRPPQNTNLEAWKCLFLTQKHCANNMVH